jgi:cysteine-rich repeat protein
MTAARVWLAFGLVLLAAPTVRACVADGQVVVRTSVSEQICSAGQPHLPNVACCSGKATPVWNPSSPVVGKNCEYVCDPTDHCIGVVCTALDGCHGVGTCNSTTGVCTNPIKDDGTPCEDGNSCTTNDGCSGGICMPGPIGPGCCGNGAIDAGEQCDDGNQSGNPPDGCTASCTLNALWECTGEPSQCCPGAGASRYAIPNFTQLECESILLAEDPTCCDGVHRGEWTGGTCNVVCDTDLCTRNHVACRPKDACHLVGICDPKTGICTDPPAPAGAACGDHAVTACSDGDECDAQGNCLPNDAAAGTPCPTSQCKAANCDGAGSCLDVAPVADGEACNDANRCTRSDHCVGGQCTGTSVSCETSNPCRVGACDAQTGCTSAPAASGTPCGTGSGGCINRCDTGGNCQPCTTTSTIDSSTTTLPSQGECDDLVGVVRASCRIRVALAKELCGDETIPTKLDGSLRRRFGVVADKLDATVVSTGGKRALLLKKIRRGLAAVERQAGAAAKAKQSAKRISSSCESAIRGLVGTTRADLS